MRHAACRSAAVCVGPFGPVPVGLARYPLRPELIESTWYLYRATRDPAYLRAGRDFLAALQARSPDLPACSRAPLTHARPVPMKTVCGSGTCVCRAASRACLMSRPARFPMRWTRSCCPRRRSAAGASPTSRAFARVRSLLCLCRARACVQRLWPLMRTHGGFDGWHGAMLCMARRRAVGYGDACRRGGMPFSLGTCTCSSMRTTPSLPTRTSLRQRPSPPAVAAGPVLSVPFGAAVRDHAFRCAGPPAADRPARALRVRRVASRLVA